jgi:hypothetical protein
MKLQKQLEDSGGAEKALQRQHEQDTSDLAALQHDKHLLQQTMEAAAAQVTNKEAEMHKQVQQLNENILVRPGSLSLSQLG